MSRRHRSGFGQRGRPWLSLWKGFDGTDFTPLADIEESDTAWTVEVELPGVKKKDITMESRGRTIVVSGERTEKEREGVLRQGDRVSGRFRYGVTLPGGFDAEAIEARLDDGELLVTVPKMPQEQPHKMKIGWSVSCGISERAAARIVRRRGPHRRSGRRRRTPPALR